MDSIVLFDPNNGEFSQWYPAKCVLDGITFNCAEQLMMYAKASMCFEPIRNSIAILTTKFVFYRFNNNIEFG